MATKKPASSTLTIKQTPAKKLASTAKRTTKPKNPLILASVLKLEQENAAQRANLHGAGCHIQALQNTITQLRDEANVMRGTITSQVREAELHGRMIKNREEDKARLVHDLTSARNEVIALQKKLTIQESVREAGFMNRDATISEWRTKLDELESIRTRLVGELCASRDELRVVRNRVELLEHKLKEPQPCPQVGELNYQNNLQKDEINRLRKGLEYSEAERQKNYGRYNREIVGLEKQVADLKKQVGALNQENANLFKEREELKRKMEQHPTNPAKINLRDMFPNPNTNEQKLQIIAAILGLK